jgi:hypothetical protein
MEKDLSIVERDFEFQRRQWPFYRAFWILMALFLTAGLAGLFGDGILSEKKIEEADFSIEYEKYLRVRKSSELIINVKELGEGSSISINKDYIEKIEIDKISPEPESVEARGGQLIYKFAGVNNSTVIFYLDPVKKGFQKLELIIKGKKSTFDQYVYF